MANERERAFVLVWRSGVLNSQLPATHKLALLSLAEFGDADGKNCHPAIASIATLSGLSGRTVQRVVESCPWIERTERLGTGQEWRTSKYVLILAEGADTRTARDRFKRVKGADTESAAIPEGADTDDANVRTLTPEGADTVSAELGLELGNQLGKEKQSRKRSPMQTFDQWIEKISDAESLRTERLLDSYSDKISLPDGYINLFSEWVQRSFPGKPKKQADWPATILNYLRNAWHPLWGTTAEGFYLKPAGQQLQRELSAEDPSRQPIREERPDNSAIGQVKRANRLAGYE